MDKNNSDGFTPKTLEEFKKDIASTSILKTDPKDKVNYLIRKLQDPLPGLNADSKPIEVFFEAKKYFSKLQRHLYSRTVHQTQEMEKKFREIMAQENVCSDLFRVTLEIMASFEPVYNQMTSGSSEISEDTKNLARENIQGKEKRILQLQNGVLSYSMFGFTYASRLKFLNHQKMRARQHSSEKYQTYLKDNVIPKLPPLNQINESNSLISSVYKMTEAFLERNTEEVSRNFERISEIMDNLAVVVAKGGTPGAPLYKEDLLEIVEIAKKVYADGYIYKNTMKPANLTFFEERLQTLREFNENSNENSRAFVEFQPGQSSSTTRRKTPCPTCNIF